MKKLVLILIAGASFATANAQIQFGVKAGANLASLTGDGTSDLKSIVNLNAGVYAKIPFSGGLSFSPEVIYSGKGAKSSVAGDDETLHLSYLDVPLLVKYTHSSGFNVATGPQVGFLMSAKDKFQGTSEDVKQAFNSVEFAWDFGVGYDIPKTPVGIEFRYNLGISNIDKNQDSGSGDAAPKNHNGVFQLGVRYTLFGSK